MIIASQFQVNLYARLPVTATMPARAVIRRRLLFGLAIGCLLLPVLLLVLVAGLNVRLAEPSQNLIRAKRLIGISIEPARLGDVACKVLVANGGPHIPFEVIVEMPFTGAIQLVGERRQVSNLIGRRPIDGDARALREFGMHDHDRASIAIEKGVAIGEITHDLTGFIRHEVFVVTKPQPIFDGCPCVFRMGKEDFTLADGDVRRGLRPVLPRPRIDSLEQRFMSIEYITIGEVVDPREAIERVVNASHERVVFQSPDNIGIFFPGDISQIPARFKIAKGIERHRFAWRR